jgi:hypothetical protein
MYLPRLDEVMRLVLRYAHVGENKDLDMLKADTI